MSKQRARVEKRKLLLYLPLLALPFLALGFYALGGGKGTAVEKDAVAKGINLDLPDAQFKKTEPSDKMGIYKLMESDTGEREKRDGIEAVAGRLGFTPTEDPQTRQINEKLAAINREINQPVVGQKSYEELFKRTSVQNKEEPLSKDVSRLESLMKTMQSPSGGDDPEMTQLNSLMDKIIAVQNPELVRQKQAVNKTAVVPDSLFKAIPAEIAVKQKAVQGSVVELRLLDTLVVKGQVIPKGHAVFGLAEFSNQRLNLEIRNIRMGNQIIPVNLTVFDKKDAMIGINAPEAVLTDVVNSGSSDAIGGFGIGAFDQSLGVQVAGAGIEAAKNMLTKRLKRVKQPLKAGYPLLLRDNPLLKAEVMEGQRNRAIGLWESWHQKQGMLESVFGSGVAAELDREKFEFLSAGVARIAPGASADEKLVLAMLRKTTTRLEKQLYPNPVLRVLRKIKVLAYDRPVQAARLRQLKADNISSLSSELVGIGVNPDKLDLAKRLDYESPRLDIAMISPYGTDHNFQVKLHMEKNDSGAYQLNGYTAMLKDPVNPVKSRSYTFDAASGVNAREAANLLQGRAVLKHYHIGDTRMGSKWMQLDFKNLSVDGKPVLKEMGADYEFNIRQQVTQIASTLEKWELTSARVLDGLEKGNQIVLKGVNGETTLLEVDAIDKKVVLRNEKGKPVPLESVVSAKKTQLEKPKSLKLSKSRKKEQGQSLAV